MLTFLGQCVENFIEAIKYTLKGNVRLKSVISQIAAIGFDSLGICMAIVFIAACVIALQVANQFLMSGGESYIGGFLAVALIREIAPGFAALALAARAGTAICATVANMQVTNQIDAIEVLKVDSVGYYFAPRIIAGAISVFCIVLLAELIGILGGALVSYFSIGLHPTRYFNSVWLMLVMKDVWVSLLKGVIFGAIVALVCSTVGYNTRGGAKNVGESTTKSAILCTVYILVADLIIGVLFYMNP
ncbi:ABC transporter permease [bacterium]|nr:ABC transporter permease [bacterium]